MNEKEILALEDKRFGAMIARDFKALEAMLHGDLLYTHSSGVTDTKATWLQSMQSGKTKYKSVNELILPISGGMEPSIWFE